MNNKTALFVAVVIAVFGAWFYFAPHLAVMGMKSAAEAEDADRLSDYVDFPELRNSLKASFNARIVSEVAKEKGGNPLSPLGAAMGSAIGAVTAAAVINPMVDALVMPENMAMMLKGGRPQPGSNDVRSGPPDSELDISMYYESFDRFVVLVKEKGTNEAPLVLVFNRHGLFSWKLSALRLPM